MSPSPRIHLVGALLMVGLLLLTWGCQPAPKTSTQEFRNVSKTLEKSDNWCFGEQVIDTLEDELKVQGLSAVERVGLLQRLSQHHLRLNHNEQALEVAQVVVELSVRESPELVPEMRAHRGLVYLRLGEVRNCLLRGNQSSCIFPLDEGAVHLDQRPAQNAFEDLLFYLEEREENPLDLAYYRSRRWLLNISAMQLGTYPDAVPERFRLDLGELEPDPDMVFEDVAAGVGIIEKNLAGGAAAEDMNGDGLIDILTSSCDFTEPVRLYLNQGDGTFEDVTVSAGLQDQTGAFNVRTADYDSDGDQDILLLRGAFLRELGAVRNSLLQNDGHGRFVDVTKKAGLLGESPTGTACWGDFNGDGSLDLFVGNETVTNRRGSVTRYPNELYINNGDGTFHEQAKKSGVEGLIYVKGVATADFDNDGDLDLFCTNFAHPGLPPEQRGRNLLFQNRGDATFQEVGQEMGIDWPIYRGFATWFFDYDNDGWQDLFVACYETQMEHEVSRFLGFQGEAGRTALYRNNQGQSFTNVTYEVGLSSVMSIMGASFGDLDNDGGLDMYLGTGSATYDHLVPNLMLRNTQSEQFEDVTFRHRLGHLQKGHGIVFCDFDNDGDQDLYAQFGGNFVGDAFSNSLFENPGNENHYLHLTLQSDFQVVGARVEVDLGDRSLHRAVGMVSSFGHTPLRQEIGLGKSDQVKRILVRWPSGATQEFSDVPVDSHLQLTEGLESFERLEPRSFQLRHPQPGDPFCEPL